MELRHDTISKRKKEEERRKKKEEEERKKKEEERRRRRKKKEEKRGRRKKKEIMQRIFLKGALAYSDCKNALRLLAILSTMDGVLSSIMRYLYSGCFRDSSNLSCGVFSIFFFFFFFFFIVI